MNGDALRISRRTLLSSGVAAPVGAVALALGACGGAGQTNQAGTGSTPKTLPPATLQVFISGEQPSQTLLREQVLPAFTARYPTVKTEYNPTQDLTKLRALAAAGSAPDLFTNGAAYAPAIAADKLAVPLDDRLKGWGPLADFFPSSLVASEWDGKRWGLPLMVAARTNFWRKNVLGEAGITKTPATWEEMVDAARRSTKVENGAITRQGFSEPDGFQFYAAQLLTVGKTFFRNGKPEFSAAEGITCLEYLLDIYQAVRPVGATPPTGINFASGTQAHTWGNMAGVRSLAQASPAELDQLVVGDPGAPAGAGKYRFPSGAQVKPVALNFSDWLSIGAQSKAQDQAWQLMQYLVEPQPLLAYCESRYFQPPRKSVASEGFMKQPHLQRMVEVFDKYGRAQVRVPDQAFYIQALRDMGEAVFSGKASPKQAVEQAAQTLQAANEKQAFTGTTL